MDLIIGTDLCRSSSPIVASRLALHARRAAAKALPIDWGEKLRTFKRRPASKTLEDFEFAIEMTTEEPATDNSGRPAGREGPDMGEPGPANDQAYAWCGYPMP